MAVKNKVQLITYPDSLGGNLKTLNNVLNKYFPNTFKGGIHPYEGKELSENKPVQILMPKGDMV